MYTIIDSLQKLQDAKLVLEKEEFIACDTEASDLNTKTATMEGIGFGTKDSTFFIPFPHSFPQGLIEDFLAKLFERTIIFHNAKYDIKLLKHNNLPVPEKIQDTMIMSWLIDENNSHGLKSLAKQFLGKDPKQWKEIKRQPDLFRGEEDIIKELADYCMDDVVNTYELFELFNPQLDEQGVRIAYERVELKLIPVLINMEMRGIRLNVSMLNEKSEKAKKELWRLEKDIVTKIKEKVPKNYPPINIRSPKQLEDILFNVYKYEVVKETEKGTKSTDVESLHEIIKRNNLKETDFLPMLLKFRDLDKVNSTYLVALAEQAGLENVIHANFLQHGTRTGRLSSNDPNLQNIPSRHDEWDVRTAFIPREGYRFLIADYSQIELRMLAHFSRDDHMVNTFNEGGDIHATTMKLAGITERRIAKNVNFGIVYGIGPRGLVALIGGKEEHAKRYINRFFEGYPMVRYFIDKVVAKTMQTGTVEMITGRKRRFHEFQDRRWFNSIARQAVNTKIQGSAADLIKIAMIKMEQALKEVGAFQLVQIHDEIIIETPVDKMERARDIINDCMTSALTLRVPLVANIVEGDHWIKG